MSMLAGDETTIEIRKRRLRVGQIKSGFSGMTCDCSHISTLYQPQFTVTCQSRYVIDIAWVESLRQRLPGMETIRLIYANCPQLSEMCRCHKTNFYDAISALPRAALSNDKQGHNFSITI